MPSVGQIMLPYKQPYVHTVINDNTLNTTTPTPVVEPIRTMSVFVSKKGRDNVLLNFDNLSAYIAEYGNPNYSLYGQPGYMPYAFLSQPNTSVTCMRVLPEDASYGNVLILAKVRVNDTDPDNPKLEIKHQAQFFPEITSESDFIPVVDATENETPDVDGYLTYPIVVFYSMGRGDYSKDLRVRISSLGDGDKDNDYKNYRIEVFTSDNGLQRVEMMAGALYNDAIQGLNNNAYALEDVVNDNSSKVNAYVNKTVIGKILAIYKNEVDPDTSYTEKDFDILTGINKLTGVFEPKIVIDKTSPGIVNIDRIEGVVLSGGSDGSFDTTADPVERVNAINEMYKKAFRGEIDKRILSKKRMPLQFIFDACYTDDVKKTLIALIIKRYDAFGFIDAGLLNNADDAITWAEYFQDYGDFIFSKQCQHFRMRDPFSGKRIPLTVTYFIASKIANHFANNGSSIPFVGETFTTLTGIVKNSLMPAIDADEFDVKETLYNKRINFLHAVGEESFSRATQTTAQFSNSTTKWSDLSEENNVHVLLEMKRIAENYITSQLYNFAEASHQELFKNTLRDRFMPFLGQKIQSFDVNFEMNEYETERGILHCYLAVTFRPIAKQCIIEIDINKRT